MSDRITISSSHNTYLTKHQPVIRFLLPKAGKSTCDFPATFPWLNIGELADYYERGNPVEGEFMQSWDFIEDFYKEDWCDFSDVSVASMASSAG